MAEWFLDSEGFPSRPRDSLVSDAKNPYKKICTRRLRRYECYRCGRLDHFGKNCPNKYCYKCGRLGHLRSQCETVVECFHCHVEGHYARDCPQLPNDQYIEWRLVRVEEWGKEESNRKSGGRNAEEGPVDPESSEEKDERRPHFKGILSEYPSICVDYFCGHCLDTSSVFLLSHCHMDRMQGIEEGGRFYNFLKANSSVHFYTSHANVALLTSDPNYEYLRDFIVALPAGKPREISFLDRISGQRMEVELTLVPAGHCLGSVMFLIEGPNGSVLYTGDFRLTEEELENLMCLKAEDDSFKRVDALYLDGTFCSEESRHFPSKRESLEAIFELIDDWLPRNPSNVVNLSCAARYGTEYIFKELHKKYNMKIHVSSSQFQSYASVSIKFCKFLTTDGGKTALHSCIGEDSESSFKNDKDGLNICSSELRNADAILTIRATALYFVRSKITDVKYRDGNNFYRVFYSTRASMEEIEKMIQAVKPKRIEPVALPTHDRAFTEQKFLDSLNEMRKAALDEECFIENSKEAENLQ